MADTGRAGAGAVTGISQKYNPPGRTPVNRTTAAPTASKSNQPKPSGSISTDYKEFAGKDDYGFVKQRPGVGQTTVDVPERPKTGHGRRDRQQPHGGGHTTQPRKGMAQVIGSKGQASRTLGAGTKPAMPARTSQNISQKSTPQPAPRSNVQSKADILTLTNNHSSNSNVTKAPPQRSSAAVPSVTPVLPDSTHDLSTRRVSQGSVTSFSSGPTLPENIQEQQWDMMEKSNPSQEGVQAAAEMDGRPRTSRGRRRRPPDAQVTAEAHVDPPAPPAFTEEVPERPKTSHGRRQRPEAHMVMDYQESMSPQEYSTVPQNVYHPIGPSPPPYPAPSHRQNSANRRLSSASRKSSIDANAAADILQQMPEVRPTSAALQKYKRLPGIGDKTESMKISSVNRGMEQMSLEASVQIPRVTAAKQELQRHYTPPQILTLPDVNQDETTDNQTLEENILEPLASPLPNEPTEGERRMLLAIRLPNGERLQRYFHITDPLAVVLKFAEQIAEQKFTGYSLVCALPKQVFKDMSMEIKDTGLQDKTVLLLQAPD